LDYLVAYRPRFWFADADFDLYYGIDRCNAFDDRHRDLVEKTQDA